MAKIQPVQQNRHLVRRLRRQLDKLCTAYNLWPYSPNSRGFYEELFGLKEVRARVKGSVAPFMIGMSDFGLMVKERSMPAVVTLPGRLVGLDYKIERGQSGTYGFKSLIIPGDVRVLRDIERAARYSHQRSVSVITNVEIYQGNTSCGTLEKCKEFLNQCGYRGLTPSEIMDLLILYPDMMDGRNLVSLGADYRHPEYVSFWKCEALASIMVSSCWSQIAPKGFIIPACKQ